MHAGRAVAVIELYDGHEECLFSHVEILRRAYDEVHVVCSRELRARLPFTPDHELTFDGPPQTGATLSAISRYLKAHGIRQVVFNTASGNAVRNFVLRNLLGGLRLAGVVHNTRKLQGSPTQALISTRIRRYFVLNDYVRERLGGRVESFYPIRFPRPPERTEIVKPPGEFWVCVPGQVERTRRDYASLLEDPALATLPTNVRIVLLGRAHHRTGEGPTLVAALERLGVRDRFVIFPEFVPYDVFHRYLSLSDLVLPLVHPDHANADYAAHQVCGTFNLSFGFGVPMACHARFEPLEDFRVSSFFYPSRRDVVSLVTRLSADPTLLARKRQELAAYEKFSLEHQSARYLAHLLG